MSDLRKFGQDFALRMGQLGLNELRNIAAFDNSKVVDDIRQTAGPQQEPDPALNQVQVNTLNQVQVNMLNQRYGPPNEAANNQVENAQQAQDQALEQQQER